MEGNDIGSCVQVRGIGYNVDEDFWAIEKRTGGLGGMGS